MMTASCSELVLPHLVQDSLRHLRRNHGKQFSLVGHVERVQPKHFASALYRVADGNGISCKTMPTPARFAISFNVVAAPPRVGSRRQ